jgi:hypothetical protein
VHFIQRRIAAGPAIELVNGGQAGRIAFEIEWALNLLAGIEGRRVRP